MSDAQKIELSMKALKTKIRRGDLLKRLIDNPDFKEFILDGFMGKERLQDLVAKTVSHNFQDPANKLYVDSQLTAIGAFRVFLLLTEQEASIAKEALASAEEEKLRALEEEV